MVELLPADQKEVLILRHYADLSFKEIAEMTGTNINTALGRMRYALLNLRKMIGEKAIVVTVRQAIGVSSFFGNRLYDDFFIGMYEKSC
jgi:hypothetical protein